MFTLRPRSDAALAALYARMPRDELEAKLRAGALVPQARAVAQAELQRRQAADAAHPASAAAPVSAEVATKDRDARQTLLIAAGFMAALLVLLWFVIPSGTYFLILALFIPTVLAPLGKRFPTWGKVLSALLIVAPVGFGLWLWQRGDLAWQSGEYRPIGTLISWGVLLTLLAACWAIAGSLLFGARHRGSWGELAEELERRQGEGMEEVRRKA